MWEFLWGEVVGYRDPSKQVISKLDFVRSHDATFLRCSVFVLLFREKP